ncbi:MAG: hypothetical protein C0603_03470 [Denitrovibrio sp.]|nr:MAG: hypothetical protein C0603_03470 [Denitrovibrio sp.]
MFDFKLFTQTEEERVKQLTGIANLHISIARELMSSERPLSRDEMESMLELLITANEAKHLAQKLKTDVETEESA